jgi:hypothetical protein
LLLYFFGWCFKNLCYLIAPILANLHNFGAPSGPLLATITLLFVEFMEIQSTRRSQDRTATQSASTNATDQPFWDNQEKNWDLLYRSPLCSVQFGWGKGRTDRQMMGLEWICWAFHLILGRRPITRIEKSEVCLSVVHYDELIFT